MLTGNQIRPLEINLCRKASPSLAANFEKHFGMPVRFGAPQNTVLLPLADVRKPLPMANAQLARQNDQVVMDYLARYDGARVSERVRAEIISRLASGEPPRADVASSCLLSEKTLQRRLKDEGTSYHLILEETRRELAQQYLRDRKVSVCEVTFRLGFSDQSSFTRAFKRWTGKAPGEFRESLASH
jgi:AraC-like DNA-binding protein